MESFNMDLSAFSVIDLNASPWHPSPNGDVERQILERAFAETGHTTSVVRFPPRARFPPHAHPGGEEFIVLEGTFSDEYGDYSTGAYLRNPVGSAHRPFSEYGCTIFVKLCQMRPGSQRVVRRLDAQSWRAQGGGLSAVLLYEDDHERVDVVTVDRHQRVAIANAELLLMKGELVENGHTRSARSWLRIPDGPMAEIELRQGAVLWRKRGHLPRAS